MEDTVAQVIDILTENRLLVTYRDGTTEVIRDNTFDPRGSSDVSLANVVAIEQRRSGLDLATEILRQHGFRWGGIPGVVEEVNENTALVRTQDALMTIDIPEINVEQGYTIELTAASTFRRIIEKEESEAPSLNTRSGPNHTETSSDTSTPVTSEGTEGATFSEIGGLERVKERIEEAAITPLRNSDLADDLGISAAQGILFYGKPGTGKTMMAKALANRLEGEFFSVRGPEVVSRYYGESEARIRDLFEAARSAAEEGQPSVVFIDEIDSLVPRRDKSDETERRIVAQFLTEIDGFEERGDIIIIGATNRIQNMDPAIRRAGRLDEEIRFASPDKEGRRDILEIKADDRTLADGVDLDELAEKTEGWTGAELERLIERAASIALRAERGAIHREDALISHERIEDEMRNKVDPSDDS